VDSKLRDALNRLAAARGLRSADDIVAAARPWWAK
jgi:hypothetical protein